MSGLSIYLFKTLMVKTADGQILDLGSPTTKSLFAYLVLRQGEVLDRRRLAFLFWPRGTEAAARRNLRQYLHRIRRALESIDPDGHLLNTAGHHVGFNTPDDYFLDVSAFEAALTPPDEALETAINLYTGDLLEDIYDDWVMAERERLGRLYRETLTRLIDRCESAAQIPSAIDYAEQFLAVEPLLEHAHTRLMKLYYKQGDRARIVQQYEQLTVLLQEELGVTPLPETTSVYQAMIQGVYAGASAPLSTAVLPAQQPASIMPQRILKDAIFVGRHEDLKLLDRSWHGCVQAQGSFVFLQGESGVGKTRLVEEWISRQSGTWHLLSGRAHEFESMIPYAPLAQALRTAAREQTIPWDLFQPPPPWLPTLVPLLPDLPHIFSGQEVEVPTTHHHIIESLGNFLLTLARHRPLIIYLDNLHWADGPTWNFLGFLAQRSHQLPLLLIGTARGEDMSSEKSRLLRKMTRQQVVTTHHLQRLSQEETYQLVGAMMPDTTLDPIFLRRVYEEAEGNPFFVIETVRAVREAGGEWTDSVPTDASGKRPFFAIPLQVQAVIEARLDKLDESSRGALGVAAAIGREFSFQLLQEVSQYDTETLLNALDLWLARGLVRESAEGYDFTHEKLSQVAYKQLSRARRQWIHQRIADYLVANQRNPNPAQLAHHYYLSSEPWLALPYLARAGQQALTVRSYAEARELGLQAIGLMGRTPRLSGQAVTERMDLNLQLAQAHAFTGGLPKALQLLQETERMAEAQGDLSRLGEIFRRSAQIFWLQGGPATADGYARRTLRYAEELDDTALRFAALRMLGRINIVLSYYDDAIAYLLRYIDLAEKGTSRPDLPAVLGYLGVAYARVGSWQRALDAAQRGLDLASAEAAGAMHIVARMQLAFVYAELREWEQALNIAAPVRDNWREEGMTPYAFMLRTVNGRCQAQLQPSPDGVQEIEAALQWAEEVDYRVQVHVVRLYLAQAQFRSGEKLLALETAQQATDLAKRVGDRWAQAVGMRTQAQIAMRLSKPDWVKVETLFVKSAALLRQIRARPDLARTYLALRRLYDRAGQSAWAVDCHFRATTIFEELGMGVELREAQGQPARERTGAVVIPGLALKGPNQVFED